MFGTTRTGCPRLGRVQQAWSCEHGARDLDRQTDAQVNLDVLGDRSGLCATHLQSTGLGPLWQRSLAALTEAVALRHAAAIAC